MTGEEYAGFWIRAGATAIDVVILIIVIIVPLSYIYGATYLLDDRMVHGFWDIVLGYVAPFVATIWFWRRFLGTPGKMATNLKIVDARTGGPMSLGQAIGRYFAYIPAVVPLGLGLIWIGVDRRKQGWHDKLAGTVVIRVRRPKPVTHEGRQ